MRALMHAHRETPESHQARLIRLIVLSATHSVHVDHTMRLVARLTACEASQCYHGDYREYETSLRTMYLAVRDGFRI